MITGISAVTLATHDMAPAVRFYRSLGFELLYGGEDASFSSFRAGPNFLNLIVQPAGRAWSWWGRAIFYDDDVDGLYAGSLRPDSGRRRRPATRNGASASSTSPTRTATS
jgi:catechol 2,3-dioxygenase-like lactoylglutathione lyase family enzyme